MMCKMTAFFHRLSLSILAFLLVSFSLNAMANPTQDKYPPIPNPFYYVNDYTKTLNQQEWRTLENALIANRSKTSSQIAVVMVPSTNGEEVASYAINLANKWGIGRTKNNENNGVLLLIAKNDRKMFIATGRGIEGALPDAIASSIIRNQITPYFKDARYAEGIASGLSAIIAAINGEYAAYERYDEEKADEERDGLIFFLAMAVIIFILFRPRGSDRYISPSTAEQLGRVIINANRRNGGFGGGFGGGSGGFSGNRGSGDSFGGGSFGGGGAGGRW